MVKADRIEELEDQITALKRQWPAHSVPPSLLQRLDDLEDELELERKVVAEDKKDA
jgi:ATP phosphoribosyltransferase regulatory subunit HisZ